MYLSVGDHHKALEIMAENGWIDRSESNTVTVSHSHKLCMMGIMMGCVG